MGRRRRLPGSRVVSEILSALPGRHRHTALPEPEVLSAEEFREISTGEDQPEALGSWGHRALGLFFWVGWFSWGIYTWWFVDRTIVDFIIGTVLWGLTFVFTFVGVPLVRRVLTARNPG